MCFFVVCVLVYPRPEESVSVGQIQSPLNVMLYITVLTLPAGVFGATTPLSPIIAH